MAKENKKAPIVLMIGVAGAGKGTQTALLVERMGFVNIDAGNIVRAKAKEDSDFGREVKRISESGSNLPDETSGALIAEYLKTLPSDKPLVIDGFPRTVGQDDILHKVFTEVGFEGRPLHPVWLRVNFEEAKRRLMQRAICQSCKTIYASRDIKTCTVCGGVVSARVDDTPEAIDKRIRFFTDEVLKVVARYQDTEHIHIIDGDKSIEEVYAQVVQALTDKPGLKLPIPLK